MSTIHINEDYVDEVDAMQIEMIKKHNRRISKGEMVHLLIEEYKNKSEAKQ